MSALFVTTPRAAASGRAEHLAGGPGRDLRTIRSDVAGLHAAQPLTSAQRDL